MSELMKTEKNSLAPSNFKEAAEFANLVARSDLVPNNFKGKPNDILIAMQMGNEVGLSPMQSIQNIAVINGRPCMWGDSLLALVQQHNSFEWIKEEDDGHTATCIVKRKGGEPHTVTFSMDDAQQAGLLNRKGPWQQYPKRMRQMRARGFALRDQFADALMGFNSAEEVRDYDTKVIKKEAQPTHFEPREDDIVIDSILDGVNEEIKHDSPTDIEVAKTTLESCSSLEDLKNVWEFLPTELKTELVEVKNEVKKKLIE